MNDKKRRLLEKELEEILKKTNPAPKMLNGQTPIALDAEEMIRLYKRRDQIMKLLEDSDD